MNKFTLFQTNDSNSRGTSVLRKAGLAAALTALTLAPLGLGATPAQADNNHRDHHDRREIRHDRREIRRDQRELRRDRRDFRREHGRPAPGRPAYGRPSSGRPGWNNSETIVRGTVVRDLPGNQFSVRTQYGVTRVVSNDESRSLSSGDYVELRGRSNGGTFYARDVNIIRNR